jgi:two-component system chemotaxis sensor kinase CheA
MSALPSPAKALGDASAFHGIFFEEADEHLVAVESILLGIDTEAPAPEDLNAIFRAVHSIKGSGAMLGFGEIAALAHELESLLDQLRKNERGLTRRDVDAMLRAGDVVKMQIAYRKGVLPEAPDKSAAEAEIRQLVAEGTSAGEVKLRDYKVALGPLAAPIDDAELQTMLVGLAEMGKIANQDIRNSAGGEIRFDLALAGSEVDLRSVLTLVVEPSLVRIDQAGIQPAANAPDLAAPATAAPVAEPATAAESAPAPEAPEAVTAAQDDGSEIFISPEAWKARARNERRQSPGRRVEDTSVAVEREGRRETDRQLAATQGDATSIRVSTEKLDRLVNLVGELVITEAMLAQQGRQDESSLRGGLSGLGELARHTRNLQEAVLAIRMVPISTVFSRFPRLVRELSQRLSKQVEIRMSGETTELDRGMIEKITDPLTHLVRNAIDHGLESADDRVAAGKPAGGLITLSASQRGGSIVIEVRDDGRGLDRARILARAAERGMAISPTATDAEVWQLVFEPGFSTAAAVTEVSGRGVGMDVVRRNIHLLGGTVDITSNAGKGTCVTVRAPLTLAIIEAMTVGASGETYVLPLASVIESRSVTAEEIRGVAGNGRTLRVRDDYLPIQRIESLISSAQPAAAEGGIAVIVEADGVRAALMVDELIGQQQVVVKSLDANYKRVPGISGATIMGDGSVALIADVAALVKRSVH